MSKHHIIYIPGMGDHKPYYQPQIINFWKHLGLTAHYHPVIWRSPNESFAEKLNKLSKLIDSLSQQGKVSLVGVSAGATAALNAYMANKTKIHSIVYICGKLVHPETVGQHYYKHNPAFKESLELVQRQIPNLTKQDALKMLSLRPIYDQTVPIADMQLPGVRNWRMISVFHTPSIFMGITAYAPVISQFVRKEQYESRYIPKKD